MLTFLIKYRDASQRSVGSLYLRFDDLEETEQHVMDVCDRTGLTAEILNSRGFTLRLMPASSTLRQNTPSQTEKYLWTMESEERYLVTYYFVNEDGSYNVRVRGLQKSLCIPSVLGHIVWTLGATFAICPQKYGCRQIKPRCQK